MDQSLLDYIQNSLNQGISRENIKKALQQAGWKKEEIDKSFNQLLGSQPLANITPASDNLIREKVPSSNKKKWIIGGIIALVLLILIIGVGGIFIAKNFQVGSKTEELGQTRLIESKMTELQAFNVQGEIALSEQTQINDGTDKSKSFPNIFTLKLNQDVDFGESKNLKSSGKFESSLTSNFDPSTNIFINGENLTIGRTDYFKFTSFSDPAPFLEYTLPSIPKDLTSVVNNWVEIDDLMWRRLQNSNGFWGPSLIPENQPVTLNVLRDLFSKSTLIDELNSESGESENSHFKVKLERTKIENLLRELFYIEDPEQYKRREQDEELEKLIKDFLDELKESNAEVWIDKQGLVNKAKIDLEIGKTKDSNTTEDSVSWIKSLKVNLNFSKFDFPMTINKPETTKKFEELPTFSDYWSFDSESKKRDYIRYSDLELVADELNFYKQKNGTYPELESFPDKLGEIDPTPGDPGNGPCPGAYKRIPNKGYPAQFLIYACLEDGKYYIFSGRLGRSQEQRPTSLNIE